MDELLKRDQRLLSMSKSGPAGWYFSHVRDGRCSCTNDGPDRRHCDVGVSLFNLLLSRRTQKS